MDKTHQRVAIYTRVSSVYQIEGDSLPMQRKDLIAYSELILGISDYEVFEDAGYSGKNTDRPAYQSMMARIKNGEFSHLLVWKIDRVSRNLLDFSEMYSELKRLRVVFVSKHEQFDTSTAMGEAMLKIILVFAELERNMTAERVTATMISRASQGMWNGGRIPYAYGYDAEKSEFYIIPEEAEVCRMIIDDYLQNKSLQHTARLLNSKGFKTRAGVDWSTTAVWIIAQSPFYAGNYRYNKHKGTEHRTLNEKEEWIVIEDHHPAIITKAEHEKVLQILENNKRIQNTSQQNNIRKNIHVFSHLCFCGKCGSLMVATPGRLQTDGYRTSIYSCKKRRRTRDCDNPSLNDLLIGEFVVNYISNILSAKKTIKTIDTPSSLREHLILGETFKGVTNIEHEGLIALFDTLRRFKGGSKMPLVPVPKRKKVDSEIAALIKDRNRQSRALQRLQDAYLYSEKSMPEKEYITKRVEISNKLEDINKKLGMKQAAVSDSLTDDEFIKKASHILINSKLQTNGYINYKDLAASTAPDILKEYIRSIIDNIEITDGHVTAITFKNGITNRFEYKEKS